MQVIADLTRTRLEKYRSNFPAFKGEFKRFPKTFAMKDAFLNPNITFFSVKVTPHFFFKSERVRMSGRTISHA